MKKHVTLITLFFVIICVLVGCKKKDDTSLWNAMWRETTQANARLNNLESKCKDLNDNVDALQAIVDALEKNEKILAFTEVKDGYVITFGDGKTVTIHNNGTTSVGNSSSSEGGNSQEHTPIVSVTKDEDGNYYWTVDGEIIKDANGDKIPVNDINNGGTTQSGVTPRFKIENGDWYVSYDDGNTYTYVGKATGDTGATGPQGPAGPAGSSAECVFKSVTQDANNVYFTLADDTVITIAKVGSGSGSGASVVIDNGKLPGVFSVSADKQVQFSQGNLQYCAATDKWRFAEKQWEYIGDANENLSPTYAGWIDLFGWGTSGYDNTVNDSYAKNYQPWASSSVKVNETNNHYGYGPSLTMTDKNLTGTSANYDWGVYNAITNGGNAKGLWRTLTKDEWVYLFQGREGCNVKYGWATIAGTYKGLVILPDTWILPDICVFVSGIPANNIYSLGEWKAMEANGAVFLPVAGYRIGTSIAYAGSSALYWSSTYDSSDDACYVGFRSNSLNLSYSGNRSYGKSVRLVQEVE